MLGGGQLGRMLALAGYPLGHGFVFLDPAPEALAGLGEPPRGACRRRGGRSRSSPRRVDVVTYEFENVPVAAARTLAERVPVFPPPEALEVSQDRLVEKTLFARLGIPTAPFAAVDSSAALARGRGRGRAPRGR